MSITNKIPISLYAPGQEHNEYFSLSLKPSSSREAVIYSKPDKILVIANVNVNFYSLRQILISERVIDSNYSWIFENGHLVVWGSSIKGRNIIECFWLIYSLEERAKRHGGYVHFILGADDLLDPKMNEWRFCHPNYVRESNNGIVLYDGNCEIWRWLHTKNFIEKIGDYLFTQVDLTHAYFEKENTIYDINCLIREKNIKQAANSSGNIGCSNEQPVGIVSIDSAFLQYGVRKIISRSLVRNDSGAFTIEVMSRSSGTIVMNTEMLLIRKKRFYRINER